MARGRKHAETNGELAGALPFVAGESTGIAVAERPETDGPDAAADDLDWHPEDRVMTTAAVEHAATANDLDPRAIAKIFSLEEQCSKAELVYLSAKNSTKEAKEMLESKVVELRQAIKQLKERDDAPLFNGVKDGGGEKGQPPSLDESWRDVPLTEALIGVSASMISKLHDASLRTVGELANYTSAGGGNHPLSGIPGIGEGKAEKIQDAMDAFWERRNKEQWAAEADGAGEPEEESGE